MHVCLCANSLQQLRAHCIENNRCLFGGAFQLVHERFDLRIHQPPVYAYTYVSIASWVYVCIWVVCCMYVCMCVYDCV